MISGENRLGHPPLILAGDACEPVGNWSRDTHQSDSISILYQRAEIAGEHGSDVRRPEGLGNSDDVPIFRWKCTIVIIAGKKDVRDIPRIERRRHGKAGFPRKVYVEHRAIKRFMLSDIEGLPQLPHWSGDRAATTLQLVSKVQRDQKSVFDDQILRPAKMLTSTSLAGGAFVGTLLESLFKRQAEES